ncbi:MAG: flippase-like domain-containing protein [Bacteroidales bacterium]|nr:flippase-like domain-containing protein [Bacteroidales bacterium]
MADIRKSLSPGRIIYPILIGLGVASWMLYRNFDPDAFSFFNWTAASFFWLGIALLMMGVRDLAYMYRVKVLTDGELSWRQAFDVIMLWEFSSAISPSVVGGTGPAIFMLYKEGINSGKSTAVILTAIFLDEVFFIITIPVLYMVFGNHIFPPEGVNYAQSLRVALFIGYGVILLYTLALAYTLFFNPYFFKWLLSFIFLLPFLRRFRMRARKLSNQLIITSYALKGKTFKYWGKAFMATVISWTGRYWVVNFMFMAFFFSELNLFDHLLIYARQLSMWIILLVSPTPGGSGVAEFIFSDFLGDLIPNIVWAVPLALLWRLITYYPYLFIGVFLIPGWVKKVFPPAPKYKVIK